MNPVFTEKDDFEYQDESIMNALSGKIVLSGFLCKEQNPQFINLLEVAKTCKFSTGT